MNQEKIGKFIAECRKKQNLTQAQLGELLYVSDRAVSKWERGLSTPDSSIMLELCSILKITVNDLLSGEIVSMNNYNENSEKLILELTAEKQKSDKRLLKLEIFIGVLVSIILFASVFLASFLEIEAWLRILFICFGLVIFIIGIALCLFIEQKAGYYECQKCGHKYIPKYSSVLWSMHINRTRYMKCPHCHKRSWNKKVISK